MFCLVDSCTYHNIHDSFYEIRRYTSQLNQVEIDCLLVNVAGPFIKETSLAVEGRTHPGTCWWLLLVRTIDQQTGSYIQALHDGRKPHFKYMIENCRLLPL